MRTTPTHVFFWGDKDIYSNFHSSRFSDGERHYSCAEQCFMRSKAMFFGDHATGDRIMGPGRPYDYKKLGRQVAGYDDALWTQQRVAAMEQACLLKFKSNPGLLEQLLATGTRILVEASPYDRVWGVGLGENDPRLDDQSQWRGENLLGQVLMSVRTTLALDLPRPSRLAP